LNFFHVLWWSWWWWQHDDGAEERAAEAARMRLKYPDRIPVRKSLLSLTCAALELRICLCKVIFLMEVFFFFVCLMWGLD
jgi:hypothetical protein